MVGPTLEDLAARYDDPVRTSSRIGISSARYESAVERGDPGAWGVGALVVHDGRALFVREGDIWLLPGGRLEPGESPATGAEREVEEETGVAVEVTGLAAIAEQTFVHPNGEDAFDFHFATFLGEPLTTELAADPGRPDEGIDEVAWRAEVPKNTFDRDLVARLVAAYV